MGRLLLTNPQKPPPPIPHFLCIFSIFSYNFCKRELTFSVPVSMQTTFCTLMSIDTLLERRHKIFLTPFNFVFSPYILYDFGRNSV